MSHTRRADAPPFSPMARAGGHAHAGAERVKRRYNRRPKEGIGLPMVQQKSTPPSAPCGLLPLSLCSRFPIYFSQASDKSSAVRLNCPGIGWWASRMMEPDRLGVTIPNHRNHRFILLPPPIPFPSLPPSIFFSRPRDNHVPSADPGKRVRLREIPF